MVMPPLIRTLVSVVGLLAAGPQQTPLRVEVLERVDRPGLAGHAVVAGTLVDATTGAPVADATVGAQGKTALSDEGGRFRLEGLEAGTVTLTVEHLAYGAPGARLRLAGGVEYRVRASVTARPIPLDSLEVTAQAEADARRRASPTRLDILTGPKLEAARVRGETVAEVVKRFPGIRVRYGRFTTTEEVSTGACVESSTRATPSLMQPPRVSSTYPFCDPLPIFVDDVYISDPVGFLHNLRLDEFEEVEILPEVQAGARYGVLAGNGGVLLLRTRRR